MWLLHLIILFLNIVNLYSFRHEIPKDLTCKGVYNHESTRLNNCIFLNNFEIQCTMYAVAKQYSKVLQVQAVLEYRTILYFKEELQHLPSEPVLSPWCFGLKSTRVRLIDDVPGNATESDFKFTDNVANILQTATRGSFAFTEFHSNVASGIVYLSPTAECQINLRNISVPPNSCIERIIGSNYAFVPGDENYSDQQWDRTMQLYFEMFDGVLRELQLSTGVRGVFASMWLNRLTDTRIVKLNASNNFFTGDLGVLPHRLHSLTNLTHLYLRNCHISDMHTDNLVSCPNLKVVDLSENSLTSCPKGLSTLNNLEYLDLSDQSVERFNLSRHLRSLKHLRHLSLANTPILTIHRSSLPDSSNLEYLDLSSCQLKYLSEDTFYDLTSLKTLILSENSLSELPSLIFTRLVPDASIFLNSNKFKNGQNLTLNKIQTLDFSTNRFYTPHYIVSYSTNDSISNLNLSYNNLRNWTNNISYFSRVGFLNLSHNDISVINTKMSESLNLLNSALDISDNLFNCQDCSIIEFQQWLESNKSKALLKREPIKCVLPYRQKGWLILNAEYNATACEITSPNLILGIGLPLITILIISLISGILIYIYRFELTYMRHLFNVKQRHQGRDKSGCKYDAFVSYSSKDRNWVVDVLLPKLEHVDEGYSLCLHERDFTLGTYIMDNIVNCIDQSRRTLLVLTPNYVNSEWCKWELQMAQHRVFEDCNDFLILLELERLDKDSLPLHLRVLMTTRTYLEWPNSSEDKTNFWTRLKASLGPPLLTCNDPPAMSPSEEQEEEDPWWVALNNADKSPQEFLDAIGLSDCES